MTGPAAVEPDDASLIAQSRHDPERFAALFDRHAGEVHRYLARRVGPDNADDLVAETFLIAFSQRDRYDVARQNARPWLYGIATKLVGRHRRNEVRFFRAIARSGADPAACAGPVALHAAEPLADRVTERVAAERVRQQLAAALAGLRQGDRDVLLLVAAGGFDYQEVALALGIPVGTVSSRLARARRKVREALGGVDPTDVQEDAG
ncbi:MAG TPA: RNA polymerase sigma factor [Streptosporangiaceae bacterium]|jgi:RNA polymerase sigma-70 factor (ECF subfamily)